jgi:hypothetical protein
MAKLGVRCAICLNQGKRVEADTIVKGYAACSDHVELVSRPDFDIFTLLTRRAPL